MCSMYTEVWNQKEDQKSHEIDRRKFLKTMAAGGVAVSSTGLFGLPSLYPAHAAPAGGKNAEERAINAVKLLKNKMNGDTLTVMVPAGGEGAFFLSKPWWEKATGVKLKFVVVPLNQINDKAMNMAITKTKKIDVLSPSPISVPDLTEAKLALDITDYAMKYGPEMGGPEGYVPPLATYGMYKGSLRGFICDGDVNSLMLRRDWLEDPDNQKAFEDRFGYQLKTPVLWDEYFDQIKFFTNKKKSIYGAWFSLSPYRAKWQFLQLLVSQGVLPLDKDMHPHLAGPEGIKAIEELIAIKPYLDPGTTTGGWSEEFKAFATGKIYSCLAWPACFKYSNMDKKAGGFSLVRGKTKLCKVPGRKLKNGMLLRPCRVTYSWIYMVSRYSANPEISYLYTQWINSPRISGKILAIKGGYFDPYRYNHMSEDILRGYGPNWQETKEALVFNLKHSYPEIMIRGGAEYGAKLDEQVIAAIHGATKPEKALKIVEKKWEEITERYGRENQKKAWNFVTTSMFGEDLRKAMNLGNPPAIVNELLKF